jgi:hypothetical protein
MNWTRIIGKVVDGGVGKRGEKEEGKDQREKRARR